VRWEIPFRSKSYESVNATAPLVSGDLVLVSATYRTGALCVRVKPNGGYEEVWRQAFPDSHFSNLILADGRLYGFAGRHEPDAELFCVELATGKTAWRHATGLGRGQLTRIGAELLLWGERGSLATIALDATALRPRWQGDPAKPLLRHPTWTPPAFADGKMYLRNEQLLLCFDVTGK
jgi:outer membrane protein assembly factor BamB